MREVERITARMQLSFASWNATVEIPWTATDAELQDLQDSLTIMFRTIRRVRDGRKVAALPQQEKTP